MSDAREGLIRALRAERISQLEDPAKYNPAFPDVADRMIAFLASEGWTIVRKQAAGKAEPPPGWPSDGEA